MSIAQKYNFQITFHSENNSKKVEQLITKTTVSNTGTAEDLVKNFASQIDESLEKIKTKLGSTERNQCVQQEKELKSLIDKKSEAEKHHIYDKLFKFYLSSQVKVEGGTFHSIFTGRPDLITVKVEPKSVGAIHIKTLKTLYPKIEACHEKDDKVYADIHYLNLSSVKESLKDIANIEVVSQV